uniref:Uncharacterized protein n=1 Tax=Anguilla anguilla TaxID=7936 RepID=A0A0E9RUR5_ANGAN
MKCLTSPGCELLVSFCCLEIRAVNVNTLAYAKNY